MITKVKNSKWRVGTSEKNWLWTKYITTKHKRQSLPIPIAHFLHIIYSAPFSTQGKKKTPKVLDGGPHPCGLQGNQEKQDSPAIWMSLLWRCSKLQYSRFLCQQPELCKYRIPIWEDCRLPCREEWSSAA